MSTHETATTARNHTVEGRNGVRYFYRRFGGPAAADTVPLVLLHHFRANIDGWDPALVDSLAAGREVVLVDNVGVGATTGTTPHTVTEMAHGALAFVDALGLTSVDVLGFSLGGYVAQEIALIRPRLVRRLVLAGTGPMGGRDMHGFADEIMDVIRRGERTADGQIHMFFPHTETGRAKGREFVARVGARTADRDTPTRPPTWSAQLDAITAWGVPDLSRLARLSGIRTPTFVANGDHDLVVPTPNTHILGGLLPDARVRIYPDAGHGFLFQYPDEFAGDVADFLA
jgi:pimeloyl-ACP methyl ester carboxylesterase